MNIDVDIPEQTITEVELFAEIDRLKQEGYNRGLSKLQFNLIHYARSKKVGVALSWRIITKFFNTEFKSNYTEKQLNSKYMDYIRAHNIDIDKE
jgi:hypothetical protein